MAVRPVRTRFSERSGLPVTAAPRRGQSRQRPRHATRGLGYRMAAAVTSASRGATVTRAAAGRRSRVMKASACSWVSATYSASSVSGHPSRSATFLSSRRGSRPRSGPAGGQHPGRSRTSSPQVSSSAAPSSPRWPAPSGIAPWDRRTPQGRTAAAIVVGETGADRREGGSQGGRVSWGTVPQQVQVPSQLSRSVHDARHLADDHHLSAVSVQRPQQWQRIEPDGVIGRDGSGHIVGLVMTEPASFPAARRRTQPADRLIQPPDRYIPAVAPWHLSHPASSEPSARRRQVVEFGLEESGHLL